MGRSSDQVVRARTRLSMSHSCCRHETLQNGCPSPKERFSPSHPQGEFPASASAGLSATALTRSRNGSRTMSPLTIRRQIPEGCPQRFSSGRKLNAPNMSARPLHAHAKNDLRWTLVPKPRSRNFTQRPS